MDFHSTDTRAIFMPLLTRSCSVRHVPGAGRFPVHPSTAAAPLDGVWQKVCLAERLSTANLLHAEARWWLEAAEAPAV